MVEHRGSVHTLSRLLMEVEDLLKHPSIGFELGKGNVNSSIALLAVQGVLAYVQGNERRASEDFETVAEEIRTRRERR